MFGLKSRRIVRKAESNLIISIIIWVIIISVVLYTIWAQNNLLTVSNTVYSVDYLPKSLVGVKIVHISDINNSNIKGIVKKVKEFEPDFILLSGGYTDADDNYSRSAELVEKLAEIAQVYYVYGDNDVQEDFLSGTGATNLTNNTTYYTSTQTDAKTFISETYGNDILKKADNGDEKSQAYLKYIEEELANTSNAKIAITGLSTYSGENGGQEALNFLNSVTDKEKSDYNIAIMGNIHLIDSVAKSRMDLVFTGGTFGVNKTDKRFTKGNYNISGTEFIVSGGVGTSKDTKRIFNFPEIRFITLSDGTIENHNPLEKFFGSFIDDVDTIFDNDGGFKSHVYEYNSH